MGHGHHDDSEPAIASIIETGRRTRKPTPRWLWIAAIIVGAVAAAGFIIALSGPGEPAVRAPAAGDLARSPLESSPRPERSGLGSGLLIGAAIGIVIGFAIARQRRDHSSRNSP